MAKGKKKLFIKKTEQPATEHSDEGLLLEIIDQSEQEEEKIYQPPKYGTLEHFREMNDWEDGTPDNPDR